MSDSPSSVKPPTNEAYATPLQPVNHNPGSYEELHRKCRDVFPMCFEGAKLQIQKGLSQYFQVSHTLNISSANTGYRFGTTYVGSKETGPGESYPVILADTDFSGNTSATIVHQIGDNYRLKFTGQVQKSVLYGQGSLERKGKLSTYGITIGNPDFVSGSGLVVGHILRRVTERLDLGAELLYQVEPKQLPGGQASDLSYAARYTAPTWTLSATASLARLQACYYHKQTENLQFGVEFETSLRQQEAVTTFAYQADLPDSGATMRASCDTNWTIGAVFEKRISPSLPFTLAISGMLNHVKGQGKFGVGLVIG